MTGRKDCLCPRARHQHGTAGAYTHDGCRCLPCRRAVLARQRDYRKRAKLADSAGTALSLPITGTTRRLQALAALGWTCVDLGDRLGITAKAVQQMQKPRGRNRVYLITARRIDALYDELSMRRPAPWTWINTRCAAEAARKGYRPPLAYDEDELDADVETLIHNPVHTISTSETPEIIDEIAVERAMQGDRVPLTHAEMTYAIDTLTRMGYSAEEAAARLGVSSRLVQRYRAKGRAA